MLLLKHNLAGYNIISPAEHTIRGHQQQQPHHRQKAEANDKVATRREEDEEGAVASSINRHNNRDLSYCPEELSTELPTVALLCALYRTGSEFLLRDYGLCVNLIPASAQILSIE